MKFGLYVSVNYFYFVQTLYVNISCVYFSAAVSKIAVDAIKFFLNKALFPAMYKWNMIVNMIFQKYHKYIVEADLQE